MVRTSPKCINPFDPYVRLRRRDPDHHLKMRKLRHQKVKSLAPDSWL